MQGFFEHQYLSYKKNHLKNLIALAMIDGHFHADEEKMIYKVGEMYGLKDRQISVLIAEYKATDLHIPDSFDKKMEQLYDLVRMVYADGVVEDQEIEFCQHLMVQYGFKPEVVPWLIGIFEENYRPIDLEWQALKEEAKIKFYLG